MVGLCIGIVINKNYAHAFTREGGACPPGRVMNARYNTHMDNGPVAKPEAVANGPLPRREGVYKVVLTGGK